MPGPVIQRLPLVAALLLSLSLGDSVWEYHVGSVRAVSELFLLASLAALEGPRWTRVALALVGGAFWWREI